MTAEQNKPESPEPTTSVDGKLDAVLGRLRQTEFDLMAIRAALGKVLVKLHETVPIDTNPTESVATAET